jgi:hypothetical protein
MIDHQQGLATDRESTMVLGKTRFGGFFLPVEKFGST